MMKITKDEIVMHLKQLGIKAGDELEVHSALSSFGVVEGGALTVIDALKEVVTESGSIFMPALRLSCDLPLDSVDIQNGILRKIKILSKDETKSRCGAVADTFRELPDTRVQDGIFAISAWGANSDQVHRGLHHVIENSGKALMLGVDIYALTAMHSVERHLPDEIKKMIKSDRMDALYPPDQWMIEDGELPKAWYKIQAKAYEKGLIKEHMIGTCKCLYFDIASVIDIYKTELINDPYGLFDC